MNKKTEGRGEIIKKGRGCVTERQTQRGGEDDAEQQMDGWMDAFSSLRHPLVISRHKILRISPGPRRLWPNAADNRLMNV